MGSGRSGVTRALTPGYASLVAAATILSCQAPEQRIVGLALPHNPTDSSNGANVQRAVRRLAKERFRASPDTEHGVVYLFNPAQTLAGDSIRRYLLVLPYGDRELSAINDTATVYLLTLHGASSASSRKYSVPLGTGRDLVILAVADVDDDGEPEAMMCVRDNVGGRTLIALAALNGELVPTLQTRYGSEDCPFGGVVTREMSKVLTSYGGG